MADLALTGQTREGAADVLTAGAEHVRHGLLRETDWNSYSIWSSLPIPAKPRHAQCCQREHDHSSHIAPPNARLFTGQWGGYVWSGAAAVTIVTIKSRRPKSPMAVRRGQA